jgi:prevent-host-death family protein
MLNPGNPGNPCFLGKLTDLTGLDTTMPLADVYPQVTATDAGAHLGRVLDQAQRGPVTIIRRNEKFVLIRSSDYEEQIAVAMADAYPRLTLAQLLAGYDKDVHRSDWPDDGPVGKETI